MSRAELPVPEHFRPETVGELFRVPYAERAAEAAAWRRRWRIPPAAEDTCRICLLAIDVQNTFCLPGFELYVGGRSGTGAVDDNRRLCEFIYRNLAVLTSIVATLDSHRPLQIFHAIFLVDREGRHPDPFTVIQRHQIEAGAWRPEPRVCKALGIEPEDCRRHLEHYAAALEESGKYDLTVWPYHALLGSIGHALVPAVEEAIFFHAIARRAQPGLEIKGQLPLTESYSALGPEVVTGPRGETIGGRNEALLERLLAHDAVIIAGQAKSHCVAWTVADLLAAIDARDPGLAARIYLLEDCASPVVVPGAVDYTEAAEHAYERFAAAGMNLVRSSEPLAGWPGLAALAAR